MQVSTDRALLVAQRPQASYLSIASEAFAQLLVDRAKVKAALQRPPIKDRVQKAVIWLLAKSVVMKHWAVQLSASSRTRSSISPIHGAGRRCRRLQARRKLEGNVVFDDRQRRRCCRERSDREGWIDLIVELAALRVPARCNQCRVLVAVLLANNPSEAFQALHVQILWIELEHLPSLGAQVSPDVRPGELALEEIANGGG